MERLITAKAVAAMLGISARKVYDMAKSGALPSFKIDDAVRFDPQDVAAYRESCRVIAQWARRTPSTNGPNGNLSLKDADAELHAYFRRQGLAVREKPRKPFIK